MVGVTAMKKALDMRAHAEVERLKQISGRAQAHVDERADPAKLNPDWREAFRAKASRVTSDDMQEVWAKVLAAEINERGSISIQTINILANMNRSDAQSFASICRFTWRGKSGGNSHVVLFDDLEDVPRHTSRYFPKCVAFWRRCSGQAYSVAVVPPKSD